MRKSWDDYFMDIAFSISKRSTCNRLNVGCVLVKDNNIISTGFNGSIKGSSHCDDIGHLYNKEGRCIRTIHAEQNAIIFSNNSIVGATAYVTHEPCESCTKLMVQAGVKRIVFRYGYENKFNETFNIGIAWEHLKPQIHKLIVVSGHSGSGKTSIMKKVMRNEIVSVTTRDIRAEEVNGKDYYYVSKSEFDNLVYSNQLVQKSLYSDFQYGVTKQEISQKIKLDNTYVVTSFDGMQQFKALYPDALTIFLYSSYDDTTKQLRDRGETDSFISKRLSTYQKEISNMIHYDYVIKNNYGSMDKSIDMISSIINGQ